MGFAQTSSFKILFLALSLFGLAMIFGEGMRPIAMFPYQPPSWQWIFDQEKTFSVQSGQTVVVAHDMLSYQEINAVYRGLATKVDPSVVVVLAPNHYERGRGDIQTTTADFETITDNLNVDLDLTTQLVSVGLVENNKASFVREHGITLQAGFIRHYFPDAKILPLIFKQTLDGETRERLAAWLVANLPADAVVLASLDFSHYLNKKQADINDAQTLQTIQKFDYVALPPADLECPFVDSTSALGLIMRYAEMRDLKTVREIWHDNSADIIGNPEMFSTTGHFYLEFL